jgi:hypothetical protein
LCRCWLRAGYRSLRVWTDGPGPGKASPWARGHLQPVDPLTPALTLVEVRWAYLDEAGDARQHTTYRYLLRRSGDGRLGIQVVVDPTPQP